MKNLLGIMLAASAVALGGCDDAEESTQQSTTPPAASPVTASAAGEIGTAERLEGWDGVNNLFRDGSFYFSGQPDEASLGRLATEEGIATVVNLRRPSELDSLDFDERAVVEGLGMTYVPIPLTPQTFSIEDVRQFTEAVEASKGPILLQCGSSNRVGGMWAAYLAIERGVDLDEALDKGRAAGMRSDSVEQAVKRVVAGG